MITSDILEFCQAAVEMLLAPFGHVPTQEVEKQIIVWFLSPGWFWEKYLYLYFSNL